MTNLIHITTPATIVHATRLAHRYGFSWFAVLEGNCETPYSENLSAGQLIKGALCVANPFAV